MSTNDNNGASPAFPIPRDPMRLRCDGLNKWEYTVIEMAKGLLANPNYEWADHVDVVRDDALRQADVLLEALSEPPASPSPTEGEALGVLRELMDVVEDILLPRITSSAELEIRKEPRAEDIFRRVDALLSQSKGGQS